MSKDEGTVGRAAQIAELIAGCDTDHRGDMLGMVADKLSKLGQHYTSYLVRGIAKHYGTSMVARQTANPGRGG